MHLTKIDCRRAALSVVKGNEQAMAFYEALGGRIAGEHIDPGPVWRSHNVMFVWDDVASLIS
jgi:RimJ/RimL family protein N-acetyltransferase